MVMVVGIGALLTIIGANYKAQSLKSVMNNVNFAMDTMVRSIRVGKSYHCGSSGDLSAPLDCANTGSQFFAFEDSSGTTVVYKLGGNGTQIVRSEDGGAEEELTSSEIEIDRLEFYVSGSSKTDQVQPRVLILIGGEYNLRGERAKSRFDLETLVTERANDL